MIRLPVILFLSTLTAFGQSSIVRVDTTNALVSTFIPRKNTGLMALLAGSTNINSHHIGGVFLFDTNSTATVDWVKVFPSSVNGRWLAIPDVEQVKRGGTGLSAFTTGDLLYAVGTDNLAALPITTDGLTLKIASGLPSWGIAGVVGGGSGAATFTKGILVSPGTTTAFTTVAGTTGYFPYWSSSYPTTTSPLWTDGSYVGFGTAIPQAAADIRNGNEFFSQTGLAHGVTDYLPTTVGMQVALLGGANGGGLLRAISANAAYEGLLVQAVSATSPTAATILFQGLKHGSGGTAVALAAGETVFQVKNSGTAMITTLGSGTSILPGLHVGAATDPGANNLTVDGNIVGATATITGAASVGSTFAVTDQTTLNDTLAVSGNITNIALTASRLVYSSAAKVLTSVAVPASDGYVLTGNTDGTVAWAVNAGASFADPGTSVTLSQQNGVATTAMRSDAAPALNVNIAPVWTGAHIFTSPVTTFGSTADYDTPPIVQLKFDMEVTSGSSARTTLANIFGKKENATSGNNAGYLTIETRPNGGSSTERLRVQSDGTVGIGRSLYVGSTSGTDPGDNNILAEGDVNTATLRVTGVSTLDGNITAGGSMTYNAGTASRYLKTSSGKVISTVETEVANKVFAGPTSGGAAVPTFRALVSADLAGVALSATSVMFAKAAETTIANTTTPTTFLDAGVGTKTITASTLKVGSHVRFRCGGYYGTKAVLPGTFQIRFTLGSGFDELITLQGFPANISSTLGIWWAEYNWSILSIGGSGTVTGQGNFSYTNPTVTDGLYGGGIKRSSTAIDTTVNLVIDVTGTWATADSSNSITCEWATIEVFYN